MKTLKNKLSEPPPPSNRMNFPSRISGQLVVKLAGTAPAQWALAGGLEGQGLSDQEQRSAKVSGGIQEALMAGSSPRKAGTPQD